ALSVADPGRERLARREEAARGSARARRYLHLPAAPRRPSRRRSAASRRREDRAERGEVSGRPGARRRAQVHGVRLSGAEGRSSCRAILSDAKTGGPQSGGACPPGLPNRREGAPMDVTTATFEQEVLEASKRLPVVVDFWAPWCSPCRTLGPTIEKVAADYVGRVKLVKVNTDENDDIAAVFNIRSIPNVIAFRNGRPVAQFIGAQPASQ